MEYTVKPEEREDFAYLTRAARKKAQRAEMTLLAYRILNRFPTTEIIEIQSLCVVMKIPDLNTANSIAQNFNCRLIENKMEDVVPPAAPEP